MPTIYSVPPEAVFQAGKGLGQIEREKEEYERGVEQARRALQQQQINMRNQAQSIRNITQPSAPIVSGRRSGSGGGGSLGGGKPPEEELSARDINEERYRLARESNVTEQKRFEKARETARKKVEDILVYDAKVKTKLGLSLSEEEKKKLSDMGRLDEVGTPPTAKSDNLYSDSKADIARKAEDRAIEKKGWVWNEEKKMYTRAGGKLVPWTEVNDAVDKEKAIMRAESEGGEKKPDKPKRPTGWFDAEAGLGDVGGNTKPVDEKKYT